MAYRPMSLALAVGVVVQAALVPPAFAAKVRWQCINRR
jgi:hypothetical protein